jgi:arylsulfatase
VLTVHTGWTLPRRLGLPGAPQGLSKEDPTLAEMLKPFGYTCGQFGKNHLGDLDEHLPTAHGFDEFFGNLYHLNAEEEPEHPDYPKDPRFKERFGPRGVMHSWAQADGSQKIEDTGPLTKKRMETMDEEVLAHALRFIEENTEAGTPWFTWFNTTRMHVNTHLKPESDGKTGKGIYADGMVEHDGHIGQLLDKLDELGIADNTIVVYTTDNGAEVMSWPDGGTTIFHGEKNTPWEGGYRIPLVMRAPGIEPGTVSNGIVSLEDILPTIMGLMGEDNIKEELKEGKEIGGTTYKVHIDGYNFVPFLTEDDAKWPRREFFYFTDDGSLAALRVDDWKVMFLEQRAEGFDVWGEPFVQLRLPYVFNLRSDPLEKALHESWGYQRWHFDHAFMLVPAQAIAAQFMSTFAEFPPRQKPGSFSIDQADAVMTDATTSGR